MWMSVRRTMEGVNRYALIMMAPLSVPATQGLFWIVMALAAKVSPQKKTAVVTLLVFFSYRYRCL